MDYLTTLKFNYPCNRVLVKLWLRVFFLTLFLRSLTRVLFNSFSLSDLLNQFIFCLSVTLLCTFSLFLEHWNSQSFSLSNTLLGCVSNVCQCWKLRNWLRVRSERRGCVMVVEVVDGVVLVFVGARWRLRCWRIVDNCLKSFVFFMTFLNFVGVVMVGTLGSSSVRSDIQ